MRRKRFDQQPRPVCMRFYPGRDGGYIFSILFHCGIDKGFLAESGPCFLSRGGGGGGGGGVGLIRFDMLLRRGSTYRPYFGWVLWF